MHKWILMIALTTCPVMSQAKYIYSWVDDEGVTHFGDRPGSQESAPVEIHVTNPDPTPKEVKPEAARVKPEKIIKKQPEIIMYGAAWCGVCRQAREYMSKNDIVYTEYDIDTSTKGNRDYKEMNGTGVPIFLIDGKRHNGFSASRFEKLIKRE